MIRILLPTTTLGIGILLLAGCAAPATEAEPTPTAGASSGSSEETTEDAVASGPECLIGDWYIAEDQMQSFYDAAIGTDGAKILVEGGTGLSFAQTTYTYAPEFAITLVVAGTEARGSITGTVTGDYSAESGVITTAYDESSVSLPIEVGGTVIDGSDLFGDFMSTSPINSAPYECTAAGPILMFDGGASGRVPMQLTKR